MRKINIKAVGIGTLVDIGASIILAILLAIIFGEAKEPLIIDMVIGLLCVTFGGLVTAKITKENKLYNATLVGVVGIFIGLPFISMVPTWGNWGQAIGAIGVRS